SGISLFGSNNALVENNTISGSDNGVLIIARPDWTSTDPSWESALNNTVRNNNINGVTYGVFLQANVQGTVIEGNQLVDNEDGGVVFGDVGTADHPQDTDILDNYIAVNAIGIKFCDSGNSPGSVAITGNSFEGNQLLLFDATGFISQGDVVDNNQINALVRHVATTGD